MHMNNMEYVKVRHVDDKMYMHMFRCMIKGNV